MTGDHEHSIRLGAWGPQISIIKRQTRREGGALNWGVGKQDKRVWGGILDGILD